MAFAMNAVWSQATIHQNKTLYVSDSSGILQGCIVPRIQRALSKVELDRRIGPQGGLWGMSGLLPEKKNERMVAHIELMLYLVNNRESFGPGFWASIARWQIDTYRQFGDKLLRDYKTATQNIPVDRDGVQAFTDALEQAVKRAHTLQEPDQEKGQLSDVFYIRNIYEDPDIKLLIASDRFSPEKRLKLQESVEDLLQQQPVFPPECYALRERLTGP
ncbi:hypothetical protein FRC01_005719 [Tulasnella sp. 417]|nr:hypothetical protein FRC01_005719 [Tulasnella sp. 417]